MNLPGTTFTFRARIKARTGNGAYLVRDTSGHEAFVPVAWAQVAPEGFALGEEVEITLVRAIARKKGFLREAGPEQGRLI